jgi:hypothetical protein
MMKLSTVPLRGSALQQCQTVGAPPKRNSGIKKRACQNRKLRSNEISARRHAWLEIRD